MKPNLKRLWVGNIMGFAGFYGHTLLVKSSIVDIPFLTIALFLVGLAGALMAGNEVIKVVSH